MILRATAREICPISNKASQSIVSDFHEIIPFCRANCFSNIVKFLDLTDSFRLRYDIRINTTKNKFLSI